MTHPIPSVQTNPSIPQAQPVSAHDRWCCISLVSGCASSIKALVKKVIQVVELVWQLISITFRVLRSRYWYGVNVPLVRPELLQAQGGTNFGINDVVDFFVRQFRVPVDIGPQVGMDPRISPAQFTQVLSAQAEIPEAPDVDIRGLVPLFDLLVPRNDSRVEDEDTPATFAQLNQGLNTLVQAVLSGSLSCEGVRVTVVNNAGLHTMLKHILSLLLRADVSGEDRIESLLELGRAGHRTCPTRMHESVQVVYERLKGEIASRTLPELVAQQLHDLRKGILNEMAGGDVHQHQEYIAAIGPQLGIRHASMAYNDNPFVMDDCAPRHAFPLFFRKYTPEKIIETISIALNGFQRTGRPAHERIERKLPLELVVGWFLENIPEDFHSDLPLDDRKVLYSASILDPETNTIKREAVLYMLVRLAVLRS